MMGDTREAMEKAHQQKITAIESAIDELKQDHDVELTEAEEKLQGLLDKIARTERDRDREKS